MRGLSPQYNKLNNGDDIIEINRIYNMDCLEGMKDIPDKSIDMILCDLPYGTTRNKWDWDKEFDLVALWKQYKRIIRDDGVIALTAQQPFATKLIMSNYKDFRYEWIWVKSLKTGFLNAHRQPLKNHEQILIFYKKLRYYPQTTKCNKISKRGNIGSNYMDNYSNSYIQTEENYPCTVLYFDSEVNPYIPLKNQFHYLSTLLKLIQTKEN